VDNVVLHERLDRVQMRVTLDVGVVVAEDVDLGR
jgi:hypothetical protein